MSLAADSLRKRLTTRSIVMQIAAAKQPTKESCFGTMRKEIIGGAKRGHAPLKLAIFL
jgi:hypothetical protein